jgi:acyl-CoA thioesterase-1
MTKPARCLWQVGTLALLLGWRTATSDPLPPRTAELPAIVVLGDSLSAGYGIRQADGWVAGLARRLQEQGYGYRVVNASVSGATTADGLARLDHVLDTQRPAVLILELGANDGLRGLPTAAMRGNLESIIRATRRAQATVVLIGMRMPENYGPEYTTRFTAAFADVARTERVPFVPFLLAGVGSDLANFQADGLHPTAAAQGAILETVWPTLRAVLKPATAKVAGGAAHGG